MSGQRFAWWGHLVLLVLTGAGAAIGFATGWAWVAATVLGLVFSAAMVAADLWHHRFGTDLLATLALIGALVVGEYFAGALIAVMLGTGRVLESYAQRRAHRDLDALLRRAPHTARVRVDHGDDASAVRTIPVAKLRVGDVVVLRTGDVLPVDGVLLGAGTLDESALTGEPLPVHRAAGEAVRSGTVNVGAEMLVRTACAAADSSYAAVVALAERALASAAPVAKLADRFAVALVPAALLVAAVSWWWSGDFVRAVAVLVTATPCPLLLAVPIAITGGMSASARRGAVVKDGRVLERLGTAHTAVLDKTGTLTEGTPRVTDVVTAPGHDPVTVLGLAAAVERGSNHVLAAAVVAAAAAAGAPSTAAEAVTERAGSGAAGIVAGKRIDVGRMPADAREADWTVGALRRARLDATGLIWVCVDGAPVAAMAVHDEIRPESRRTLARLRAAGVRRLVLVTGDRAEVAADVGRILGLDDVVADATPADKVDRVRAEQRAATTIAVGDGINDAPALAAADVGIALAGRGPTATAQIADAVLTDGRIDRLADAVEAARRSRRIAVQSAAIGVGLSLLAMLAAAAGLLVPAAGAVVQEFIDLVAVANALRALAGPAVDRLPRRTEAIIDRFRDEHPRLRAVRMAVRHAADALSGGLTGAAEQAVREAHRMLVQDLLPHERAEQAELYPAVAPMVGGDEGVATMSRGHAEIERLVARLARHLGDGPLTTDQLDDLRATLYGLDAVLTLHFAQEEQGYFALADPGSVPP